MENPLNEKNVALCISYLGALGGPETTQKCSPWHLWLLLEAGKSPKSEPRLLKDQAKVEKWPQAAGYTSFCG